MTDQAATPGAEGDGAPPRPGWWPDELATIGRENLDAAHVDRYDHKEDAAGPAEVAWLRSEGVGAGATVVDLGAGTGQFALEATETWARVVAVDPSPVMRARLEAEARARRSPLEVVAAGFLTYDHAGERPDLVYSRLALHHLPDTWKAVALHRVRRLLRPGGLFRLWDVAYHFPPDELPARVERWCAAVEAAGEEWTRADVEEHVRDEHSTFTWLLEPMIERAGFEVRHVAYTDDGVGARYLLAAT